ncbi:T9SS type A sorting domain-containing protein [Longimonas halophila]|nr:T9SS type A sorting domain-containing protein [Longimonas halophila]
MRRIQAVFFAFLLCAAVPYMVHGQPTIDGTINTSNYQQLAEWTQSDTGFGDHGILELWAERDGDNLYVFVLGEAESNGNEFYLFIDVDSQSGVASGTQLPSGNDGLSPFASFQPTNDFETDYGLRLQSGVNNDPNDDAFVSIVDYVAWESGDAEDTFLGTLPNDGTTVSVDGGTYDGTTLAYNDTGDLSSHTGVEGWELSIPLSAIGASPGDEFQFLAMYGADSFISANTLPEISGQSGTNLGDNPDFTGITGDQHTTPDPLPVELASFTAALDGTTAQLQWETLSETNNAGFEVQHAAPEGDFEAHGFVEGYGTTDTPQQYTFRVDDLAPGTHRFRLKQTDFDGTSTLTEAQTIEVALSQLAMLETTPNPMRGAGTIQFAVQEAEPVTVSVYNVLGQRVETLYDGTPTPDQVHTVSLDTSTLSSGTYFVRIEGATMQKTRRVAVVR